MEDFPTKDRSRARRRFLKQKMKQKAKRIAKVFGWDIDRTVKDAEHLASCGCRMCKNPREVFHEKTIQEYKADEDFKDQLKD